MNVQKALKAASLRFTDINVSFIESVLSSHTKVDAIDEEDGLTSLQKVAKSNYTLLVEALLDKGAAVNALTSEGYTALHLAAYSNNQAVVALLLSRGAAVNMRSEKGWTPLYMAISAGHQEIAKVLLDKEANVNMVYEKGRTPLHIAIKSYSPSLVELLLSSGAKINVRDEGGCTPLSRANCLRDLIRVEMLKVLLRYGAYSDPNNDENLQGHWHAPLRNQETNQSFYTFLLLAGVPVPEEIVLSEPLQAIRNHIEATVLTWLAPLALSSEGCAALTSKVLRALPQLLEWLNAITPPKAQSFVDTFFEHYKQQQTFQGESQNEKLLKTLEEIPEESVKDAFSPVPALTAERVQATYDLPTQVATYLVDEGRQHLKDYTDFQEKIFTHDWLAAPCVPPGQRNTSSIAPTVY